MYDVALSVLACVRAGTEVHVAWIPSDEPTDGTEAVAVTPGGGKVGSLLGGALDDAINRALPTLGKNGGTFDVELGPAESLISNLPPGTRITIAIAPGAAIPTGIWTALAERRPVSIAFIREGDGFTGVELLDESAGPTQSDDHRLICRYVPVPRIVIVGEGPIADALEAGFELVGWQPAVIPATDAVGGVTATLSSIDGVIVMGHDVETSSRALMAAITSQAGYIGSLGSVKMQELREEWLAYRGVTWSDRIHGPAGLPIGAVSPGEIAVSIVAEAVAASRMEDL